MINIKNSYIFKNKDLNNYLETLIYLNDDIEIEYDNSIRLLFELVDNFIYECNKKIKSLGYKFDFIDLELLNLVIKKDNSELIFMLEFDVDNEKINNEYPIININNYIIDNHNNTLEKIYNINNINNINKLNKNIKIYYYDLKNIFNKIIEELPLNIVNKFIHNFS